MRANLNTELYFRHAEFNEKHRDKEYQKSIQVENPERAEIVMNSPYGIMHRTTMRNVTINREIKPALLGDIVRVHDSNYIGEIK